MTDIEFLIEMANRMSGMRTDNPWRPPMAEHLAEFIERLQPIVADALHDEAFVEALAIVNNTRDAEPPEGEIHPPESREIHARATTAPTSPPDATQRNATRASGEGVATQHAAAQAADIPPPMGLN